MHHFYETRQRGMDMSEQGGSIVALIQFNPIVGDIEGNAHRLEQLIRTAAASGAVVCGARNSPFVGILLVIC